MAGLFANYSVTINSNGSDIVNDVIHNSTRTRLNLNISMEDYSINAICDENGTEMSRSMCDRKGLGISLSTPILMLSAGVIGNIIAIIVLLTAQKEMKKTVFYTFLIGLALTDLTGQLLTGPIAIIVYANKMQWVGGEPLCKYHAFVMVFLGMITPLFVCCMSIERVLALRCPYVHTRIVNKKRARIVILCCYAFVTLFCCQPFIGFGSYAHQFPGSWCFLNFHKESPNDAAYAYTYAFISVIMITVIVISNCIVMVTLIKMKKTRKINNSPSIERRTTVRSKSKIKMEEETQMIWFLFAITVVFTTCWFPLNINILINQVTGRVNYAADLMGVRLASINQILDPYIYILLRKKVIVKGFRLLKRFICREEKRESPKRYITNYSENGVNNSLKHRREDQELNDCHRQINSEPVVGNNYLEQDTSDSCSVSSVEQDEDREKRLLNMFNSGPKRKQRCSDSGFECKRHSYDSFPNLQNGTKNRLTNRQMSLPARSFKSS